MKLRHILLGVTATLLLFSCQENAYLGDVYVKPEARFTTEKSTYEVFESVVFTNAGSGQNYVVYTGDPGHVYGEPGDTGFATASNGSLGGFGHQSGRRCGNECGHLDHHRGIDRWRIGLADHLESL